MTQKRPDLHLLDDVVADRVLAAMRTASEMLTRAKIRHALCGGLAVGAHGHARATKDVDFLVGEEAFVVHPGGIVTLAPGVPIQIGGVAVDHLSAKPDEAFLGEALEHATQAQGVPVLGVEPLVYLKLVSPRPKDRLDVLELIHAGLDVGACERWLTAHAPTLLPKWQAIVAEAWPEE
jgi:hypothetical protein